MQAWFRAVGVQADPVILLAVFWVSIPLIVIAGRRSSAWLAARVAVAAAVGWCLINLIAGHMVVAIAREELPADASGQEIAEAIAASNLGEIQQMTFFTGWLGPLFYAGLIAAVWLVVRRKLRRRAEEKARVSDSEQLAKPTT